MFSVGEQLYRLTLRDEETLLVDPFFRRIDISLIGAGTVFNFALTDVPTDRMLYVDKVVFVGGAFATAPLGNWQSWLVQLDTPGSFPLVYVATRDSGNPASAIVPDGRVTVPAAQDGCVNTVEVKTIFPAGFNRLRCSVSTTAKSGDGFAFFHVYGYLLPPGRFGRR